MTERKGTGRERDETRPLRATTERRTGGGPRAISRTLDAVIARSGGKRGFAEASLLLEWSTIVGADLARRTAPEKLVRSRGAAAARLHLRVAAGWAIEVQHMTPVILERINGYFGYRAVDGIRIVQGLRDRGARTRAPLPPRYVGKRVSMTLDSVVASVEDPEMAAALRDLADAVRNPGS